jgi:hypothetical protein
MNGSFSHHQAIFIGAWSDKDVISWSCVVQRVTWKLKTLGVLGVDDERFSTKGIIGGIAKGGLLVRQ